MGKLIFVSFLFCMLFQGIKAQTLKGCVKDENRVGIPGATLYIREEAMGSVTNEQGEFELKLAKGVYTCEISALGYEKQVKKIEILPGENRLDVQLEIKTYLLKEVKVTRRKEDPAYSVMRHVIANAPFHLNQVKHYKADIYTKGNMCLEKLPKLLMLSKEVRKEVEPYMGKLFVLESVTKLSFEAPNHYERKIIAFSSTIPDEMEPGEALDIMSTSIYDPNVLGMISPLSPGAFSYYRFQLEDYYTEGQTTIDKIRVIPRKKNRSLFEGWLYIAEGNWSVVNFELILQFMGVNACIKSVFHEVKPEVYLPTSYDIDVKVKLFGVRAGGKYYSSVKYEEVEAETQDVLAEEKKDTVKAEIYPELKRVSRKKLTREEKARKQLEELSNKEELSTREAYQIARLSRQLTELPRPDSVSDLEVREPQMQVKVAVDSMAMRRDSSYWVQMRTIPLKEEEWLSYQKKDSLREVVKRMEKESDTVSRARKNRAGNIIMGGDIRLGKHVGLNVGGLLRAVPEYNFVDGFWIGQQLTLDIQAKKGQRIKISPSLYYATARKTLLWEATGQYTYSPGRRGRLEVGIGYSSTDYKGREGVRRIENAVSSLIYADNFIKYYGTRYVNFQNSIDVMNGWEVAVRGKYEKRKVLENHISYNFYKKDPDPNTPSSEGGADMPDNTSCALGITMTYTPRYYYRMNSGKKEYLYSHWPTFSIDYERGIPMDAEYASSYNRLELGIKQTIRFGIFNAISYGVWAGRFFKEKEIYFPDYKHFYTTGWIFDERSFTQGFYLTDYYELATREKWIAATFNYGSNYLFLKRLPFLQRFLFNEALHFRYLWTPEKRNQEEFGYSLGFGRIARAGVFFGFDRSHYRGAGVRISISLDGL